MNKIFDFMLHGKITSSHENALDHEFTGIKFLISENNSQFTGHRKPFTTLVNDVVISSGEALVVLGRDNIPGTESLQFSKPKT